jgi:hypothetical protein
VVPVVDEARERVNASSCVSAVIQVDEEATLGEINTPPHVFAALVDDRAVDATPGDEAIKEVNTSKIDTEQMPVIDISDSIKDGDEPSDVDL